MSLTLTGYSTALFSTWFFIEEFGVLFDAGDGVASGLLQKSGKVRNVFISHADRDHLTGLFQFNQLNARDGYPIIHYPKDCGSFPAIQNFTSKFDPHVENASWVPISNQSEFEIKKGIQVEAFKNNHVSTKEGQVKSLSYHLYSTKQKLKEEYRMLSGKEIAQLKQKSNAPVLTEMVKEHVIGYSGDTPVDDYSKWDNSNILIHEATFIEGDKAGTAQPHGNKHSTLEEVVKMASEISIQELILSHFSSRYSTQFIDQSIRNLCKEYRIKIPVRRLLPGCIHKNILSNPPIND